MDHNQKPVVYAKMTSKNQVTVPKQVREILGVKSHDELAFEIQNDETLLIKKRPKKEDFWGIVAEQQALYDQDEEELEWGDDVGSEVIDW